MREGRGPPCACGEAAGLPQRGLPVGEEAVACCLSRRSCSGACRGRPGKEQLPGCLPFVLN